MANDGRSGCAGTLTRDFKHTALDFSIVDEEVEKEEEDDEGNVVSKVTAAHFTCPMINIASVCCTDMYRRYTGHAGTQQSAPGGKALPWLGATESG